MAATDINWLKHPSLILPAYTYADAARLTRWRTARATLGLPPIHH